MSVTPSDDSPGGARKQAIAKLFNRAAPTYSQVGPPIFQHFAEQLVDAAHIRRGSRVLDICTGRGAILFLAAQRATSAGEVVGIDLSDEMVAQTTAEIQRRGLPEIDVLLMDAEHLIFPDATFDTALCGFGLFFMPDMTAALQEWQRVLRPGGRLAVSTWGEDDPRWAWLPNVVERYLPPNHAPIPLSPAAISLVTTSADGLMGLLEAAGYASIHIQTEYFDAHYASAEEWLEAQWSVGARAFLEMTPPTERDALVQELLARVDAMATGSGIPERRSALIASGLRPD